MYVAELSVRLALLIFSGFLAGKLRIVSEDSQKGLMKLLMNITLPCLIFASFAAESAPEDFFTFGAVALAAVIALGLSILLGHVVYVLMGRSDMGAAAKICITFGNVTFFGIPVVEALYGGLTLMYYNIFAAIIRMTNYAFIAPLLGSKAPEMTRREKLKKYFSPQLVALFLGLAFSFSPLALPTPVLQAVSSLGAMTSPLGMLIIGAMLSRARFSDVRRMPVAFLITALRLVIMPAAALGLMLLLGVQETTFRIVMLFIATPVATLLPTYIMHFRPNPDAELLAGVSICLTSVLCVLTIPAWVMIMERLL